MLVAAIYAQIILIAAVFLWFALLTRRTNLESLVKVASITVLLLGLWVGGVWVYPPLNCSIIVALVFAYLTVLHFSKPVTKISGWSKNISNLPLLVLLPIGFILVWQGVTGRQTPTGEFVELSLPFK